MYGDGVPNEAKYRSLGDMPHNFNPTLDHSYHEVMTRAKALGNGVFFGDFSLIWFELLLKNGENSVKPKARTYAIASRYSRLNLMQCGYCGCYGNSRKIKYHGSIIIREESGIVHSWSLLCNSCAGKLRPISEKQRDIENLEYLTRKLRSTISGGYKTFAKLEEIETSKKRRYNMKTGELRAILVNEIEKLRSGHSNIDRAKEVVRLANSTNELLRTELNIKKTEMSFKEAGSKLTMGDVELSPDSK